LGLELTRIMEMYQIQLIESFSLIIIVVLAVRLIKKLVEKAAIKYDYHKTRVKIMKKVVTLILVTCSIIILVLIWGIAPSQLLGYIASLLTVVGLAFFAQWSVLSNITATLIIFFSHQVKIGDRVAVLDQDFKIEGKVSDIGVFFIIIKVNDNEYVSMPSNVFFQKMVKRIT
jgi:small-conductance mechanosensitive channel